MKILKLILMIMVAAVGVFSSYLLFDVLKRYYQNQQISDQVAFPKVSLILMGMAILSFFSVMYNFRTLKYYKAFPRKGDPLWDSTEMQAISEEKHTTLYNSLNLLFGLGLLSFGITIAVLLYIDPPSNTTANLTIKVIILISIFTSALIFVEFRTYYKKRKKFKKLRYEQLVSQIAQK